MGINAETLVTFTETLLTGLHRIINRKKVTEKRIHPVADWGGAFIWAVIFVFLLNQYLLQAYVIPSKSMENTLEPGDRVVVNKAVFGPELLPGALKINGISKPDYSDIIIFENPEYKSRGTMFNILSRLVFMFSLSLVDIDKDDVGNPAHHFLIKRSVASDGDIVRFENGDLFIKPRGEEFFIPEDDYKKIHNVDYTIKREVASDTYRNSEKSIKDKVYSNHLFFLSEDNRDLYYTFEKNYKYLSHISPSMINYYQEYNRRRVGIYIPDNWLLTLGDNRDNSKDGRFFGVISNKEVLGRADFRFWPLNRSGGLAGE